MAKKRDGHATGATEGLLQADMEQFKLKLSKEGIGFDDLLGCCITEDGTVTRQSLDNAFAMLKGVGIYPGDEDDDVSPEEGEAKAWEEGQKEYNETAQNRDHRILDKEIDKLSADPAYKHLVNADTLYNDPVGDAALAKKIKKDAPAFVNMLKVNEGRNISDSQIVANLALLLSNLAADDEAYGIDFPGEKPTSEAQSKPKQPNLPGNTKSTYIGLNPEDLTLLNKMGILW